MIHSDLQHFNREKSIQPAAQDGGASQRQETDLPMASPPQIVLHENDNAPPAARIRPAGRSWEALVRPLGVRLRLPEDPVSMYP